MTVTIGCSADSIGKVLATLGAGGSPSLTHIERDRQAKRLGGLEVAAEMKRARASISST